jgi:hypothetical protein
MAISEPTVGTGIWPIVKHRLARTARFGAELIAAFVGEAITQFLGYLALAIFAGFVGLAILTIAGRGSDTTSPVRRCIAASLSEETLTCRPLHPPCDHVQGCESATEPSKELGPSRSINP